MDNRTLGQTITKVKQELKTVQPQIANHKSPPLPGNCNYDQLLFSIIHEQVDINRRILLSTANEASRYCYPNRHAHHNGTADRSRFPSNKPLLQTPSRRQLQADVGPDPNPSTVPTSRLLPSTSPKFFSDQTTSGLTCTPTLFTHHAHHNAQVPCQTPLGTPHPIFNTRMTIIQPTHSDDSIRLNHSWAKYHTWPQPQIPLNSDDTISCLLTLVFYLIPPTAPT